MLLPRINGQPSYRRTASVVAQLAVGLLLVALVAYSLLG